MKLICLTYAGGNASFYDKLASEMSHNIEICSLEYAGHGTRHKEPFYNAFSELAEDMYLELSRIIAKQESYALMGYSMGSISVVELLKLILERKEFLNPKHIFLAAHEPFTKSELRSYSGNEIDQYVKERTIRFGGISEKLINNESFWRVYLPIYRADYSLIAKYDFDSLKLQTSIPLTVFYSEEDTPYKDMMSWNDFFVGKTDYIEYSGTHFFINEHYQEMAQEIRDRLVY